MRSVFFLTLTTVLTGAICAPLQASVLSDNILVNGDFESLANLKNAASPDGVLPHRFSQTYDLGQWIAYWGPQTNPGGLGGFSTWDDPRDAGTAGSNNITTIGNLNRSVDPTNASNHLMETTMFRPKFAQWVEGPANQVAGPFEFAFDFYHLNAHPGDTRFDVRLYGMNVLPAHDVSFFDNGGRSAAGVPNALDPSDPSKDAPTFGSEQNAPFDSDGELLVRLRFGEGKEGQKDATRFPDSDPLSYLGVWHHMDTGQYTEIPDPLDANATYPGDPETGEPLYIWRAVRNKILLEMTQTYDYYAVVVIPFIYDESDAYFWALGSQVADSFAIGMDNFSLKVSLAASYLPGDFDGSGVVDTQDINPFILALTNPGQYQTQYGVDPVVYDTNDDDVINTEDINPFIIILTGGAPAIIPEPASFGLLAMGGLALARRRRR